MTRYGKRLRHFIGGPAVARGKSDPAALKALIKAAGQDDGSGQHAELVWWEETPWASPTFEGQLIRAELSFADAAARQAFLARFDADMFAIPGKLIVEAGIEGAGDCGPGHGPADCVVRLLVLDDVTAGLPGGMRAA
jgi:hypothetical protein